MLNNTEYRLACLAHPGGVTAMEAVRAIYATTSRPMVKAGTFYRHLRRMARRGLVVARPHGIGSNLTNVRFTLTPAGLAEGRRQNDAENRRDAEPPTFPRLASPRGAAGPASAGRGGEGDGP